MTSSEDRGRGSPSEGQRGPFPGRWARQVRGSGPCSVSSPWDLTPGCFPDSIFTLALVRNADPRSQKQPPVGIAPWAHCVRDHGGRSSSAAQPIFPEEQGSCSEPGVGGSRAVQSFLEKASVPVPTPLSPQKTLSPEPQGWKGRGCFPLLQWLLLMVSARESPLHGILHSTPTGMGADGSGGPLTGGKAAGGAGACGASLPRALCVWRMK